MLAPLPLGTTTLLGYTKLELVCRVEPVVVPGNPNVWLIFYPVTVCK